MGVSAISLTIMAIGSCLGVLLILLIVAGGKYNSVTEGLDSREFPLCELYGIGFVLTDLFHHDFSTKKERKRHKQIALIYGDKYSEYYLRVNAAERLTLAALLFVAGFALYGLSGEPVILVVMTVFAGLAYYYVATLPETTVQKKKDAALNEFADVVSKLALLVNAGMILKEAWEKVASTGDGELYREMRLAVDNMNNGMSEVDAYTEFGMRSNSPEIKKFTSTIIQGLVKGNRELVEMIKQQSREIWDSKRHRVRQQGEKAASKLLIPICVMFIGVLIMIVVPIFANLGI